MPDDAYDPLYLRGIAAFNRRCFFESHEIWEELWIRERGPSRPFYQGLIQVAVALHHLTNGNTHGARKLLAGARNYLKPFGNAHLGLDVDGFLAEMQHFFQEALSRNQTLPDEPIDPASIPQIRLQRQP